MAPVDRCAQRSLARGRVARAAAEHIQRARESAVELFDAEQPGAGRRQLDRERQSVEPPANLRDRACVALRQLEACLLAARALHEQRAGGGKLQWADAVEVLGLQAQRLPARRQHCYRRPGGQQVVDHGAAAKRCSKLSTTSTRP